MKGGMGGGRGRGRGIGRGQSMRGGHRSMPFGTTASPQDESPPMPASARRALSDILTSLRAETQQTEEELQRLQAVNQKTEVGPSLSLLVAVVDTNRCVACGACQSVCTTDTIRIESKAAIVRDSCIGCGRCVIRCAHDAISLHKR